MSIQGVDDFNLNVVLSKRPGKDYPEKNDIFTKHYLETPEFSNIKLEQVMVLNRYISIDAAMRVWISGQKSYRKPVEIGDVMPALCIAEVIFSRSSRFEEHDLVIGEIGWQKYKIVNEKEISKIPKNYPSPSHFLGVLGTSGLTAYFGLEKIGRLESNETIVVSAAAGAVGQVVVQLAAQKKCRIIAMAGSEEKCRLVEKLGAQVCLNYKSKDLSKQLKEVCSNGIDVYFDNVGGEILDTVLQYINDGCRIVMCGAISQYNSNTPYYLKNYPRLIIKRGLMQGFIVSDYKKEFKSAIEKLTELIGNNQLKLEEEILNGLDSAPEGLKRLLQGNNKGKVVIKVEDMLKIPENAKL